MKEINFGTLNVRGSREDYDKEILYRDVGQYNIQILGFTESHIIGEERSEDVNIKNEIRKYQYFGGGIIGINTYSGVGCIIDASLEPTFKRITDRICVAEAYIKSITTTHKHIIVTAYAPTLIVSEREPEKREAFFEELDNIISKEKKSKNTVIMLGDFNAKTGSGYQIYKENMGKYGKGKMNSNGEYLLNVLRENDMVITNTLFPHKLSHRTTWTAPERKGGIKHFDRTARRNPIRNQIDYIIIKTKQRMLVTDARSYGGCEIYTDHKLVKMTMKLNWWKLPKTTVELKHLILPISI